MVGSNADYGTEEYQYEIETVLFVLDHLAGRGILLGRDAGSCG
jgi:hypothetical protein